MNDKDELMEMIDHYLHFDDELLHPIIEAFQYPPIDDVDSILMKTYFYRCVNGRGSWHVNKDALLNKSLILIDDDDLQDIQTAVITILHESAHSLFDHFFDPTIPNEVYRQQEDEVWAKVREWLPESFTAAIDKHESEGGGSNGIQNKRGK
mgnify:CR=1 FL=1